MAPRRSTSAETAARFLAMRRGLPVFRESREFRFVLNIAAATLTELKACVDERLARYEREGTEPPHITLIARQMLDEAVKVRS